MLENVKGLPPETRILFFRFGGFTPLPIITAATVDSRIAQLREAAKKNKGKTGGKGRARGGQAEEASLPEQSPTKGYGTLSEQHPAFPAEGIRNQLTGPDGTTWSTADYGEYLYPTGPAATMLRQLLGLHQGEPERGQCMLLNTAGSILWRTSGVLPRPREVHGLASTYRLELLQATIAPHHDTPGTERSFSVTKS